MPDPSTAPAQPSFPGVSRLVLVANETFPRYSEGDVVELTDGRLLLAVGRKAGASDFAAGEIIGMFSSDRGATWDDEPHVIQARFGGLVDLMSTSFCRSPRGLHLFFLGRGKDAKGDTQPYQVVSADEGKTWGEPKKITLRGGYYVVNNARVVRTSKGRMLVPAAYVGRIDKEYDGQSIVVLHSDDDGVTWRESNVLKSDKALMEPGVAECADGSVYMTIRTTVGVLYEARSRDGGATWGEFGPTRLPSPAAPSTVVRAPGSNELWMFWCNSAKAKWKQRSPQVFARSKDHGATWSEPRFVEHDPGHSYGYISVTRVANHALLTYYDWADSGQRDFHKTSLRQRTIPLAWLRGEPTPPVFRKPRAPVLRPEQPDEGPMLSTRGGLLVDKDRWRLWYSTKQMTQVGYAESRDAGLTWEKAAQPALENAGGMHVYNVSTHRADGGIVLYAWHVGPDDRNGVYRHVSRDDGKTFTVDPGGPMFVSPAAGDAQRRIVGEGRVSAEPFSVSRDADGTYTYFAPVIEKPDDARALRVPHDNYPGIVRCIGRATSRDGITWSALETVLRPSYDDGDATDTQFNGMQVFRRRGFHLGLLHVFHAQSGTIQPEWAWSHNGEDWARTRTPCVPLGDEGSFDGRQIVCGDVAVSGNELICLYSGYDWRHHAFRTGHSGGAIGRAVLPLAELDAWLDTLPQP